MWRIRTGVEPRRSRKNRHRGVPKVADPNVDASGEEGEERNIRLTLTHRGRVVDGMEVDAGVVDGGFEDESRQRDKTRLVFQTRHACSSHSSSSVFRGKISAAFARDASNAAAAAAAAARASTPAAAAARPPLSSPLPASSVSSRRRRGRAGRTPSTFTRRSRSSPRHLPAAAHHFLSHFRCAVASAFLSRSSRVPSPRVRDGSIGGQ